MLPLLLSAILLLIIWTVLVAAEPLIRGTLARSAHFTTKFRYRDYLPVVLVVAIGAAASLLFGDAFVDLAEMVRAQSDVLQRMDQQWHDLAVSERTPGSTTFFAAMSVIGGPVVLGVVTGVVAGVLFARKRFRWAIYLLVTAGGGACLNIAMKHFFERSRPALAEMLRRAHGYSFPSGHAMGATVCAGAMTYLAMRALKTWWQKAAAIAFGITFTVAVATSRVYLGVHWISDIGAGVSAGLLWVAATTVAYETSRRVRLIRELRKRAGLPPSQAPTP